MAKSMSVSMMKSQPSDETPPVVGESVTEMASSARDVSLIEAVAAIVGDDIIIAEKRKQQQQRFQPGDWAAINDRF